MDFLLLILVVTALIWGLNLAVRCSPLTVASLYLIAAGAIGFQLFNFDVAGISFSIDRLLVLVAFVTFLVQRKLGRTDPKPIDKSEWCLIGFMLFLVANIAIFGTNSPDPHQVPIVQHMIEGYLIPCLLYWFASRAVLNERSVNRLQTLFVLFGIYLGVTAVFEITGLHGLVFPKVIVDSSEGIHFGRARGPFLQSVRLGIYLFAALAFTWIPLVWRGAWGRPGRALGVCLVGLFLAGLVVTLTRSVWLGVVLASLMLFACTLYGVPRRAVFLAMLAAAIVTVGAMKGNLTSFKREFGVAETQESTHMRVVFAYVSWLMVKERPISGHGFGHFPYKKDRFLNDRSTNLRMETIRGYVHHNTFLSLLVDLGVVGFMLYLSVLTGWFRKAWRLWRDASIPIWVRGQAMTLLLFLVFFMVQMMFHEVSYSPMENGLLFLIAGVMSGLSATYQPAAPSSLRSASPARFPTWSLQPRTS